MPTQIVDNFQLNVAKPIDSRMVTSGTSSRDNLPYRYNGLRVYDTTQDAPYVWMNGTWKQESSGGGGGGSITSGTTYTLLKYTSSTTIGDSAIIDKSTPSLTSVGIGIQPTSGIALTVKGIIKINNGDGGFNGDGSAISNINGFNIQPASIPLDRIVSSTIPNQVLITDSSNTIKWSSNINSAVIVTNSTTNSATHYLLFTDVTNSTTGNSIYANNGVTNKLIGVKPSTSQILASINNEASPSYSFTSKTNSGLYCITSRLGLSFNNKSLLELSVEGILINGAGAANTAIYTTSLIPNGVLFGDNLNNTPMIMATQLGSAAAPDYTWVGDVTTGMYRPGTNQVALTTNGVARFTVGNTLTTISTPTSLSSTLVVSGATTLSSTLAVTSAATFSSTLAINASDPFALLIKNSQSGIKTTTNGEFLKSIQNTGVNYNYMAFHKTESVRRGYIGYGASVGDSFIIANETTTSTGNIVLYTNSIERVNISNSNTTIKTPLIVESNVATAIDSGLIIKDSSTSNRGAFWMTPYLNIGQYNYTVEASDFGLLFSSLGYNTKNGSNGFVIAPHTDTVEGGIRIDDTGRLEAHGGLTIGKKTSTSSHNGTIIERLITGRIEARIDGGAITGAIAGTSLINGVRVFDTSPKYSVNMIGSGLDGARVRITWTPAFLENNIFPIVTGVNGSGTAIYPALWDGTKLEVQTNGLASGTFTFNFIVLSISN